MFKNLSKSIRFIFYLMISCFLSIPGIVNAQVFSIKKLKRNFYVYTSYGNYNGVSYPANGLLVVSKKGAIVIDAPWNPNDYQKLIDIVKIKFKRNIVSVIATHWHDDRAGGFNYFAKKGYPTYATEETNKLLKIKEQQESNHLLVLNNRYIIGDIRYTAFYPGVGHTSDNILIWFPNDNVLYGGCFIRSLTTNSIGNYNDGDPKQWLENIRMLKKKFNKVKYVIPGHDDWKGIGQIERTEALLTKFNEK